MTLPNYFAMPGLKRTLPLTCDHLMEVAELLFGIKADDLKGKRRTKEIVMVRQCLAFILYKHVGMSLQQVGACLGGRHHTTILYSNDLVFNAIDGYDPALLEIYNKIVGKMYENL